MRRYVLGLLLIFWGICGGQAQTVGRYKMTLTFSPIKNTGNDMKSTEYRVSSISDAGTEHLYSWSRGSVDENRYVLPPDPIIRYFNTSEHKLPKKLEFWSKRTWSKWIFSEDSRDGTSELSLGNIPPYLHLMTSQVDHGEDVFLLLETTLTLEIIPVSIKLHYYTGDGQGIESTSHLLPDNDEITLKATKGFIPATYQWQYRVAGENSWHDVPSHVRYSEANSVITFKGTDLFTRDEFNSLIETGKNVLFRINAITEEHRDEANYEKIILTPTYSIPHILSYSIEQERCHKSDDASIRVTLDRKLRPREALALSTPSGIIRNIEALDASNSFIIPNLTAGSYHFTLKGTHHSGLTSYSQHTTHQFTAQVVERAAIMYSLSHRNVSCFGGHDGVITLTASGGTGRFTAELYSARGSLLATKTFKTGNVTFDHLAAGDYSLRVKDSNGCIARTRFNDELIQHATLSEPRESVTIEHIKTIEPLAHNASNGLLKIAVLGGTPSSSGYNVRFIRKRDGQAFTPTSSHHDGEKFIYTLANLSQGEYTIIAEDLRYSLLTDEDKKDPCGCRATLELSLMAPPPLSVTLEESHHVSCYGGSDGAITAQARGGRPIVSARLPYTYSWYRLQRGIKTPLTLQSESTARGLEAGLYLVKITDANGISIESSTFDLRQPKALSLSFRVTAPSCSDAEGVVVADVRGGTPPYSYEWNKEGANNATLKIQESGNYFVRVTDSRGCSITGSTEVTAPDAISVKSTITHPTCHGANNGAISLNLSGGKAPYSISWEDNPTNSSTKRERLKAGVYVAHIKDRSGCTQHYRITLNEPESIILTLNQGFTLCKNQSRLLHVRADVPNLSYQWRRNGQALKEVGASLLVDRPGLYEVIATTTEGCSARASVEIKASNTELPIDITAPSSVSVNEPIHVVNISRVKADRLEWQLPDEAQILQRSDEGIVIKLGRAGTYEVRLLGYLGDCTTLISQRIEVVAGGNLLPKGDSPISQFLVTPNPTTGSFQVLVELKEASDFTLRLLSPTAVEMDRKELREVQRQSFHYELRGEAEGVFSVELTVGKVKSLLKVTKKN